MLASCSVTEQHIRGRIGRGELFFWHDYWMGDEPLVNRFPSFASSMILVSNFYQNGSWHIGKLNDALLEDVVTEIMKIPIDESRIYEAYWAPTSDGKFTTKSAWEIVRQRHSINFVFYSIWHRSIPLSISFFLWRLFQDWIPVDLRLKSKGFQLVFKCQHCNSKESLFHVMWECPLASQVWNYFAKFFQIYIIHRKSIYQIIWAWLFSSDYTKKGHIHILIPLFIFWFLWVERNDAKHRNLGMYPNRKPSLPKPKVFSWQKPLTGEFKLNVDGGSKYDCQSAAGGRLLRDHTGTLIFSFVENFGPYNSLQAELMALYRGLLLCIEHNVRRLWIEMDAKVVIQMIHRGHKGSAQIRYLLASIRKCLSVISFRISHIHREGNQAADLLSNQGYMHQNLHVFSQVKGQLKGILGLDKNNLRSEFLSFHELEYF
ncbi:RNase H family protein [Theobroma cacao]|uniref:RNase H family protein n=1 Tax=Theobroma cacao TaxID=3641 RepID=A0A061FHM7_THECC|nr:RNase H family protein [Theobroma cacao]